MTFKDKAKEMLMNNGFFAEDAVEVVNMVINAPENEAMQGRWNDDISEYPPIMLNIMHISIKRHALAWIDKNKPKAWFRPIFAE